MGVFTVDQIFQAQVIYIFKFYVETNQPLTLISFILNESERNLCMAVEHLQKQETSLGVKSWISFFINWSKEKEKDRK